MLPASAQHDRLAPTIDPGPSADWGWADNLGTMFAQAQQIIDETNETVAAVAELLAKFWGDTALAEASNSEARVFADSTESGTQPLGGAGIHFFSFNLDGSFSLSDEMKQVIMGGLASVGLPNLGRLDLNAVGVVFEFGFTASNPGLTGGQLRSSPNTIVLDALLDPTRVAEQLVHEGSHIYDFQVRSGGDVQAYNTFIQSSADLPYRERPYEIQAYEVQRWYQDFQSVRY